MDYYDILSLFAGPVVGFLGFIVLLFIAFAAVEIIATWRMFKKAGKQGWESIIPFYGSYVLTDIAGLNWWWFLLLSVNSFFGIEVEDFTFTINIVGFLASFNCYYNIARRFGKDTTTSVLAGIFPYVFVLIFGFSKKEVYSKDIVVNENGIFGSTSDDNKQEQIKPNDKKKTELYCGNCGTKLNKDAKFCANCGKKI